MSSSLNGQQSSQSCRNVLEASKQSQFIPKTLATHLVKVGESVHGHQSSINLVQSTSSQLRQPHERVDSDEIILHDSEDGFDDTDDCEFNSLEGNNLPSESRVPMTQTKFNQTVDQLNQLNKLDAQNRKRI